MSELGVAATLGLHGGDTSGPSGYLPNYNTTITSEAKHYAACVLWESTVSLREAGLTQSVWDRYGYGDVDGAPADMSIPTLYDVYLRPWKAYIEAGGRGAMAAHNSVNGRPCHSSKWLLTNVFREEFGCAKCLIGTDFRDIQLLSNMNTANTSRCGLLNTRSHRLTSILLLCFAPFCLVRASAVAVVVSLILLVYLSDSCQAHTDTQHYFTGP